mmetsp:Transcript_9/g.26  ORF Transcript_9/g.26 Transcript_9/m.26 type:complete len:105 (-) Transcript_9:957-1271(-)
MRLGMENWVKNFIFIYTLPFCILRRNSTLCCYCQKRTLKPTLKPKSRQEKTVTLLITKQLISRLNEKVLSRLFGIALPWICYPPEPQTATSLILHLFHLAAPFQ